MRLVDCNIKIGCLLVKKFRITYDMYRFTNDYFKLFPKS